MKILHGNVPANSGELKIIPSLDQCESILHFSFPGVLPHYQVEHREKREIRQHIRNSKAFYSDATLALVERLPFRIKYDHALIYIIQFFPDFVIRDFDNRERKYVLDALRYASVIGDDNWRNISVCESGEYDSGNPHTEIFISSHQKAVEMFTYVHQFCISPG
ncbi:MULTISPECIES: hypothetical protein [Paenibacillus]|uniref:Uncharacterized protein n=2 Tax=Paenibacillus TaxID=44249 RepID=A0A7Y6BTI3_9BACL|nr:MULTISPECIES: hypothetical protein [Paenibacillus]KGP77796.1 hypothetical protein P364_0131535 [Paenibacillus sp. MAEPY2]KGP79557.1 hypothetical protein P363_0130980 [Paenibacillus sp. MAEPY1]MDN4603974.1 hypothetical protein [Paenibacillus vandeheii]NUU74670.1 hypothetical protein [Paenibacillus xylanilyticus]